MTKLNTINKTWKNISIDDVFPDGSKVTSVHESYTADCYDVSYVKRSILNPFKNERVHCVLSDTHLLLCDLSKLSKSCRTWVEENFGGFKIPTLYDKHVYCDDLSELINEADTDDGITRMDKERLAEILEGQGVEREKLEVIKSDDSMVSSNQCWLPVSAIFLLSRTFKQRVLCNGHELNVEWVGPREVFCVETDTHKFETVGLTHHNSVTLRNIIFHCLTHGEQICIALIDLKYTEFTPFKGVKNVVAVANTVREAAEIMRLGREVMYKRNQELAKLGINDIKDFRPTKPTDEVIVAGRRLKDTDIVEIKVDGEIKQVSVKELEQYL